MALIGGRGKAVRGVTFHGWHRVAEKQRIEREYEARLAEAEAKHAELEKRYKGQFQTLEANRSHLEHEWDRKFQRTEEERRKVLEEIEEEKRQALKNKANKAAMTLIGNNRRAIAEMSLTCWRRVVEHEAHERELQAHLREIDEHKAQMQREHDAQLGALDSKIASLHKAHDAELKRLAEAESQKMRQVENEFNQLQDDMDLKIRKHEDEKIALIKEHDDAKENLLKENKALVLMHRDIYCGAADSTAAKTQAKLVRHEFFTAWSQLYVHSKLTRSVEEWTSSHKKEADRIAGRRENAAELLAVGQIKRMALFEVFTAWERLAAASQWDLSAEQAAQAVAKRQRWRKTEAVMFIVSKDQSRLMLMQVLEAWLHCVRKEVEMRRASEEAKSKLRSERESKKAISLRWALRMMDSSGIFLAQKILSSWWLWARECRWGARASAAAGRAEKFRSKSDQVMLRTLLRAEGDNMGRVMTILFAVWKSRAGTSKSKEDYRAEREKLLDRWGMQYGMTKASLFWHRVFAGWLRVAKVLHSRRESDKRHRAHGLRIGEKIAYAMDNTYYAFWTWLGNTSLGRKLREAKEMGSQVAYLQMKHEKCRDGCSGIFINLHSKAFIHVVLHSWWKLAHTSGFTRELDRQSNEVLSLRRSREVTHARFVMSMWNSKAELLLHSVFASWRQLLLDQGRLKHVDRLEGAIANVRRRAADYFKERPLAVKDRFFGAWRHVCLEKAKAEGVRRQRHLNYTSRSLAQEMEDNDIYRTMLLAQGFFTRWKHWTANVRHNCALDALRQQFAEISSHGPGRVLSVVSAIEDQRDRLMLWETFARWSLIVRMERTSGTLQVAPVTRSWTTTYLPQIVGEAYLPQYVPLVAGPPRSATPSYVYPASQVTTSARFSPSAALSWVNTGAMQSARAVNALPQVQATTTPTTQLPTATIGVDANHDGKPDFWYTGVDRNCDGIPDALQQSSTANLPTATVGIDSNQNGQTDYYYTGVDMNRDGIPDVLQANTVADRVLPRRPAVRRRQQVQAAIANSPPILASAACPTPSLTGSVGTLWDTTGELPLTPRLAAGRPCMAIDDVVTTPCELMANARMIVAESSSPSAPVGYPIQRISGAPLQVTRNSGVEMTPPSGNHSPGLSWTMPVSPRQAAPSFSEVIPPPATRSSLTGTQAGGSLRMSSQGFTVNFSGAPPSLTNSVRSVRSVSPPPRQGY
jgi:hypothetical protein